MVEPFWNTELLRVKKALGNFSAALLRLMYGLVHFQGLVRERWATLMPGEELRNFILKAVEWKNCCFH